MLSPIFHHLLIPFLVAIFLAVNMGGSGTAPSFSVAFGTGVIRRNLIPGLFGLMVFLGAIIAGKATTITIGAELVNPLRLDFLTTTIVLFSIASALLISNLMGIPQSTSQTTVIAISAVSFYFGEFNHRKFFLEIVPTWLILPPTAYFSCYFAGKYIYSPLRRKGLFIKPAVREHPMMRSMIIATSLYVAFSIGANNVANAAGPVAMMTFKELNLDFTRSNFLIISILTTLLIAPYFGIGSSLFGYRIVQHTGRDIIMLGKMEAVIVAFVSASLLILASVYRGIPSSLVQVNVAAILGIGAAKLGAKRMLAKSHVRQFFTMWIVAPFIAFLLCYLGIYVLEFIQG